MFFFPPAAAGTATATPHAQHGAPLDAGAAARGLEAATAEDFCRASVAVDATVLSGEVEESAVTRRPRLTGWRQLPPRTAWGWRWTAARQRFRPRSARAVGVGVGLHPPVRSDCDDDG